MPQRMYLHANKHKAPHREGHYQLIPPRLEHWCYINEETHEKVVSELAETRIKLADALKEIAAHGGGA